jgi:HEAT repeat protein
MRSSPFPPKRLQACKKLGEVGGERAIPHLIHALDDKAPSIRKAAIGSLKQITGTDLNYNPMAPRAVRLDFIKEWEKWWREKQDKEGLEQLKETLF